MRRIMRHAGSWLLAAALAGSVAGTGCAVRAGYGVRVYDRDHRDYHSWDDREDRAYRQYLGERHEDYRDYHKLNRKDRDGYWNWRHAHPD